MAKIFAAALLLLFTGMNLYLLVKHYSSRITDSSAKPNKSTPNPDKDDIDLEQLKKIEAILSKAK